MRIDEISRRTFVATSIGAIAAAGFAQGAPDLLQSQGEGRRPRRILALVASPRKGGNTDTLTRHLLEGAHESGAVTEKIYLVDQKIAPCVQCEYCHQDSGRSCRLQDDFGPIAEKMMQADVIVLATPIWWSSMHSLLKILLDRCYSLVSGDWTRCKLAGRKLVLIACQGQSDLDLFVNPLVKGFKVYEKDMKIEVLDALVASAYRKGEIAENRALIARAVELGKRLAAG